MNGLHALDLAVFRSINVDMHRAWLDPFFAVFSYLGTGGWTAAVCLLFILSKNTRSFVVPLLVSEAVGGFLLADTIKLLIPRDRPSNLSFAIRQEHWLTQSFPSGHTTTAFSVAVMLVLLTWNGKLRWAGVTAIPIACLVGLSRIYRGVHWPTDVLAGICFGTFTACALYLLLPKLGIRTTQEF